MRMTACIVTLVILSSVHAISAPRPAPPPWLQAFGRIMPTERAQISGQIVSIPSESRHSICSVAAVRPRIAIGVGEGCKLERHFGEAKTIIFSNGKGIEAPPIGPGMEGPGTSIYGWRLNAGAPATIPIAQRIPPPRTLVTVFWYRSEGWSVKSERTGIIPGIVGHEKSLIAEGSFVIYKGQLIGLVWRTTEPPQFIEYANVPRVIGKWIPGHPAYMNDIGEIAAFVKWLESIPE